MSHSSHDGCLYNPTFHSRTDLPQQWEYQFFHQMIPGFLQELKIIENFLEKCGLLFEEMSGKVEALVKGPTYPFKFEAFKRMDQYLRNLVQDQF